MPLVLHVKYSTGHFYSFCTNHACDYISPATLSTDGLDPFYSTYTLGVVTTTGMLRQLLSINVTASLVTVTVHQCPMK